MRGCVACSCILALGLALAAPALAETPDDLPAQVSGVVGSGDQLSLQLKPVAGAVERTLHLGESFPDGWVLSGLTSTAATLTRSGVSRTVGLNPTGAVAGRPAEAAPSSVRVIGGVPLSPEAAAVMALSDEEVLRRLSPTARQNYDTRALGGLTLAESQRYQLMTQRSTLINTALRNMAEAKAAAARAQGVNAQATIDAASLALLLGSDYPQLQAKMSAFAAQQATQQYQAAVVAGVGMVFQQRGRPSPISSDYAAGVVTVAYNADDSIELKMPAPRSNEPGIGVAPPPAVIPTLTEQSLAGLTLDGAPLDPAMVAQLLASNRQIIAYRPGPAPAPAGVTLYGPFGPISP